MKKWENPQINTLRAEKTNAAKNYPHFWKCTACGKHHGDGWWSNEPEICGYNGCQNTEFEFVMWEEEVIPGGGES